MPKVDVTFTIEPENNETISQLTDALEDLFRDSGVPFSIKPVPGSGFTFRLADGIPDEEFGDAYDSGREARS